MLIELKSQVGTVLYSVYHLGRHPGSIVTMSGEGRGVVRGISPGMFGEVKVRRKRGLEGQRTSHWSLWTSWNFSGNLHARHIQPPVFPCRESLGRGPGWAPGSGLETLLVSRVELDNELGGEHRWAGACSPSGLFIVSSAFSGQWLLHIYLSIPCCNHLESTGNRFWGTVPDL